MLKQYKFCQLFSHDSTSDSSSCLFGQVVKSDSTIATYNALDQGVYMIAVNSTVKQVDPETLKTFAGNFFQNNRRSCWEDLIGLRQPDTNDS